MHLPNPSNSYIPVGVRVDKQIRCDYLMMTSCTKRSRVCVRARAVPYHDLASRNPSILHRSLMNLNRLFHLTGSLSIVKQRGNFPPSIPTYHSQSIGMQIQTPNAIQYQSSSKRRNTTWSSSQTDPSPSFHSFHPLNRRGGCIFFSFSFQNIKYQA